MRRRPGVIAGRCLECGSITTFTPRGKDGALVCDVCGIEYPPTVYPEPRAYLIRGDAAFRDGKGYRVFEENRPEVPTPWYFKLTTGSDVDGRPEVDSVRYMIMGTDALGYIENHPKARREKSPPGIITYHVPQELGRWWKASWTDDPTLASSLDRRSWRRRR